MRIALFSECWQPVTNGVVTSMTTLRDTLRARGHTVYVIAPGANHPDDDSDVFRLKDLPFPRHPYHFVRPFPRLGVDFSDLDADIIHCQHPFFVGWLGAETASRHGLPMVYTAHSLYGLMAATAKSPIVRNMGEKAARGVVRRFCAKADYVITPSRYTRDALRADGVASRFAIVPNGVEPPVVRPGDRERMRALLGVQPDQPVILYVGRLGPEKHLDMLLEAVARLRSRRLPRPASQWRLVLVGEGQAEEELAALAGELHITDRVHFAGSCPRGDVGAWYSAGDLFAFPSPWETQGLVLVEAMSCGLPCVAVDAGGPRELVLPGETGLLTPVEAAPFSRALEAMLMDPDYRARLGANGQARALDYAPDIMADGVLEVYESASRAARASAPKENRLRRSLAEIRRHRERIQRGHMRPQGRTLNRRRKRTT